MTTTKTDVTNKQLALLGLKNTSLTWDDILSEAKKKNPSYFNFLTDIVAREHAHKRETLRHSRIKRANIREVFEMVTFPFDRQPQLKKRMVLDLYDSLEFMKQTQELIFIGPTGCGKTGLATSFLTHALIHDYRGYFIDFKDLVDQLYQSLADHSDEYLVQKFASYDCLVIDELGYAPVNDVQAGLFFDLMRKRHGKKTTLITTQLGFSEWDSFLKNTHLTAALIDRLTVNCTLFNLTKCKSIRPKKVMQASKPNKK